MGWQETLSFEYSKTATRAAYLCGIKINAPRCKGQRSALQRPTQRAASTHAPGCIASRTAARCIDSCSALRDEGRGILKDFWHRNKEKSGKGCGEREKCCTFVALKYNNLKSLEIT
ncbi:MAG: hypothetical protein IJ700_05915 [Bacteroidaceae bacterium]|nr:hypothetical protein [Bacteroidaceae bacterium]